MENSAPGICLWVIHGGQLNFAAGSGEMLSARPNCISHFLSLFDYTDIPREKIELSKGDMSGKYNGAASLQGRTVIP